MTEKDVNLENIISPDKEDEQRPDGLQLSELTFNIMNKLKEALPYLEDNLQIVTSLLEMQGLTQEQQLTQEQYDLIMARNRDANLAIASIDFDYGILTDANLCNVPNIEERLAIIACWSIIDLRDHVKQDLKGDEQEAALNIMQELIDLLKMAGYVKINPMYQIPYKPQQPATQQ